MEPTLQVGCRLLSSLVAQRWQQLLDADAVPGPFHRNWLTAAILRNLESGTQQTQNEHTTTSGNYQIQGCRYSRLSREQSGGTMLPPAIDAAGGFLRHTCSPRISLVRCYHTLFRIRPSSVSPNTHVTMYLLKSSTFSTSSAIENFKPVKTLNKPCRRHQERVIYERNHAHGIQ